MNKKYIRIIVSFLLLIIIGTNSLAISMNEETFIFSNKNNNILANFNNEYNVSSNENEENSELKQTITDLTKKTTYLLLGEVNNANESSENYYKRHQDYLNLRYNPEVPKDASTYTGLDESSQEYKDDNLSGLSVPGMFLKLNELGIKYKSYGQVMVSIINDELVISTITLPNVQMKEPDSQNPMKYNNIQTDLTMYYYFKKLNNEYKLLYLYGETNNDIEEFMEKVDEEIGNLSKNTDYNSKLEDIYDFSKAKAISDNTLNNIYNENKAKIVYLNAVYNTGSVTSANGFFISEGIIVTTYNFLEKALMKAQNIIISDSLGNAYELDGIVTANEYNDVAILKTKGQNSNYIKINDIKKPEKEDAVIALNSRKGIGLTTYKGIVTATDNNIQTSLISSEEIQGSPIFDGEGNLIGMLNSKTLNSSISFATKTDILKEYYLKFSNKEQSYIECISFDELKENYYTRYNEEKVFNNIQENKWNKYSKAENINDYIEMTLVKASYVDGIISLRYKNDISNYIDTMQWASAYMENLKNKGYEEKNISSSKAIYQNKKYQIILMTEFDYLIVVMVKL